MGGAVSVSLEALAEEIRKHAEVYRGAMALADMLELTQPLEASAAAARARLAEAQGLELKARADQARAENDRDAARREHAKAVQAMTAEYERREKAFEQEMRVKHAELVEAVRVQEIALSTLREQEQIVNDRLNKLREALK
jgi:hypothetical protein